MVRNYIDGRWVDSTGRESVDIINPATEEVLDKCPLGTAEDVNRAVAAAQAAFPAWRQTPVIDRVQYLFKLKSLLEATFDEIVALNTAEHGKTLVESRGDVRRGIQMVETACGMPSLMMGQCSEDVAAGIDSMSVRQPMGVFAAITPFNFPAMVPFWFWPFAIASGNTFVLKPSERVPLTQVKIFGLLEKTGLPKGVMNLVAGSKDVVNALCTHPDVKGVSFVGSTPVAKHVYQTGTSHGKRVQALGGAKNFMVILPDAAMDTSISTCLESIIGCAGQRCLAGSVIISVGDCAKTVSDRIVRLASDVRIGNGADPQTHMGPVISRSSLERIHGLIQSAALDGAQILLDGRQTAGRGYFLKPTVIAGVTPKMRIAQEEIFGPVVCLANTDSLASAIQWINSSPFANTASLFTNSGAAARQFSYEAAPAMLGLNIGVPAPMAYYSFGGAKDSFFGDVKAHGAQGVLFFTDQKVTISRWKKNSNIW
ncbi:MAG: CoA-acylating methylmalonate-semialdehyde dehydrogenase [Deltaproteobacteria bacterium]|nr:CoA-acylating methylmalonate-semialdehyde dehydrogenase [Deltaproteobacteria bacterium]MBI3295743.1 CoA-acylating methylmalonate-semialdehyde dehydrogenase [Deltaproteobacteria bacterium]